jgi:hypothetical protein
MIRVKSVVAIRGELNASFPDLRSLKPGDYRVPGRDLAELILVGLKRHGIDVEGPFYDEPFFTIRCRVSKETIEIQCYIYEPAEGVWIVEATPKLGFIDKLLVRHRDAALSTARRSMRS